MKEKEARPQTPDEKLDLSGVLCPQNAARTLLRLAAMDPGKVLEIIVDDGEPAKNVPASAKNDGHSIIKTEKVGDKWKILIKRA